MTFLLQFTSCTEWLTIKPESEVVLEDYWKSETHVTQSLAGCYRSMMQTGYMDRLLVWGEVRSDNVVFGWDMPDDMARLAKWDITTGNGYNSWGSFYTTINYCNTLLHYAPDVVNLDENFTVSELHQVEAEAKAIRALSYFYLVRTFQEVPYVTTPSLDDTQNYTVSKSTEDEILNAITEDLLFSLTYARDQFDIVEYNRGLVTKNMVRALLADIALWRNDFASCINYCNQIIASGSYKLVEAEEMLAEVFYLGNSTESIFELQFDRDDNPSSTLNRFYEYESDLGFFALSNNILTGTSNLFSYKSGPVTEGENDIRYQDFLDLNYSVIADIYPVFKYAGFRYTFINGNDEEISNYLNRYSAANWIIYRYSDILLMKSEALVQQKKFAEALELVNQVYLRSNVDEEGIPVDSLKIDYYSSFVAMESLVLRERQRELMFEGKRWFDLMRLARRNQSTGDLLFYVAKKDQSFSASKYKTMNSLYLPISSGEMKANTALVQNPFYQISDDGTITK